jgi:hypothetical protein
MIEAAAIGAVVGCLNGFGAWCTIRWTLDREFRIFMIFFMGGMLVRLLLVGVGTFLILYFTEIHRFAYVGGLACAIVAAQIVEISTLLKRLKERQ